MASFASHGTLTANTVATVTLTGTKSEIEVINRTGTAEIYFTIGTTANPPANPTIGGDDCYVVPASIGSYIVRSNLGPEQVKLISTGAMAYSVIGEESAD